MGPESTWTCRTYAFACLVRDTCRDIETYLDFASEYGVIRRTCGKRISALLSPSVTACTLYRISHLLFTRNWRRTALAVAWFNFLLTKVSVCPASEIGGGLYIPHPGTSIVFEGKAGKNLRLFAGSGVCADPISPLHNRQLRGTPTLGDDVTLGSKAFVLGGVRIGSGCKIGINTVVCRDLPVGATALAVRRRVRGGIHAG